MTGNNSLPPGELEQLAREESHPSALLTEADMRKFRNELTAHAYDTLALCPDHRDKVTGRCIVCVAEERVRQEMKAPAGSAGPPFPILKEGSMARRPKGLRCAWCRKPASGFLCGHPHCGRSHVPPVGRSRVRSPTK